jgi:NOL1/NOP2/sun family putative RNA methylase
MQKQLGREDYEPFLQEYEKEGFRGLRVNTGKISAADFSACAPFSLSRVPWTENGFYYGKEDQVTRHPWYYAGLYYVQEPSAMLPASRLPVAPGDLVLDLCAAPGGKATELASRLQGEGMLVANDVSATRAKALLKNLSIWGAVNCCVTGETPEKLLQSFGCCFDRILVDAPCSGEGMFRKDTGLIQSWEERGPEAYAPLQQNILDCAVQMLRPGGYLLYSTCTFSKEEDEQVIAWILERYPSLETAAITPYYEGFTAGNPPAEQSVRVWPHRMKGEGHYLALLHKQEQPDVPGCDAMSAAKMEKRRSALRPYTADEIEKSWQKAPREVLEFLARVPRGLWERKVFVQKKELCYLLPPYHLPERLRFLGTGLLLGTFQKGRFEPSQPLAMALDGRSFDAVVDLPSSDVRVTKYLKGETLELEEHEEPSKDGWVLVCTDGYALGWGKCVRGRIKNKYSPGWRMM